MQLKIGQKVKVIGRKSHGFVNIGDTLIYLGGISYCSEDGKMRTVITDFDVEPVPQIDWNAIEKDWNTYTDYMRPHTVEWFKTQIEKQLNS